MIDLRVLVEQPLVQALAWTLLHFLWQGALLGFAAFILLRVVRPSRASTRYAIGVATLALMLLSSVATFVALAEQPVLDEPIAHAAMPASVPQSTGVTGWVIADLSASPGARALLAAPRASDPYRTQPLEPLMLLTIVVIWSAGVLALSFRLLGGWILTRRLARRAVRSVSPSIEAAAGQIAGRLRLTRAVAILQSGAVVVPTLVGWVRPVVLLPAAALSGLSAQQLEAILAHELAHVRRHDYLINLLQSVVETLLFYHPATWWVSARVREEREHCCDDLAIDVCGDRLVYVSALAELTSIAAHPGFALAATDGSLSGRVRRILGGQRAAHDPPPVWPTLGVLLLTVAGVSAVVAADAAAISSQASVASDSPQTTIVRTPEDLSDAPIGGVRGGPAGGVAGGIAAGISGGIDGPRSRRSQQTSEDQWPAQPPVPPAPPAAALPPAPGLPPAPPAVPAFGVPPTTAPAPPAPGAPAVPPLPHVDQLPPPPARPAAQAPVAPPPAPPAPPAAPPEAPSAPDAEGTGHFSWSDNGEKISIKWTGAFRLSADEKDIEWVEEGRTVTVSDGVVFAERVDLKGLSGGRIERTYSKNGFRRDYDTGGRQFLADAIDKMIRRSGMFARDRVARFLKQGGPDAVLAEMDRLAASSYVKRVYYTELMKQTPLDDALVSRVLQRVAQDVTSDYDRAVVLSSVAKLPAITDAHRAVVARASKAITSDYEQRRALAAVMASASVVPGVAAAVVDAASTIGSSYERSVVLSELARKGGVTPATAPAFMDLVRAMPSSNEQRRVLAVVAAQPEIPEAVTVEAIRTAGTIDSAHEQAATLLALIERGGVTDVSAESFFASVGRLTSAYERARVLRAVAARGNLTDRVLTGVLRAAAALSSAHERAMLLLDVAARYRLAGEARDLYIAAARGMGSEHYENRALAALVRAERR
jgi:beta-lactamase regulating signal transducer with metallopeptidase domain